MFCFVVWVGLGWGGSGGTWGFVFSFPGGFILQFASVDFIHFDIQAPGSIKNRNKSLQHSPSVNSQSERSVNEKSSFDKGKVTISCSIKGELR